jgi:hypothetical protein
MAARASAKRRRSDGSGEPEAEAQGEQRVDEPSQPGSALV